MAIHSLCCLTDSLNSILQHPLPNPAGGVLLKGQRVLLFLQWLAGAGRHYFFSGRAFHRVKPSTRQPPRACTPVKGSRRTRTDTSTAVTGSM